ncbi:MAG: glycosyltransferase [Planctomycetota bacterium]
MAPSSEPNGGRRSLRERTDGVVCFGGVDWWYHNRGHYDLQMMRELSASLPVLYVNSIGVRTPKPSEGRMFVRRVRRKLKSIARGYREVRPHFSVLSPPSLPVLGGHPMLQALTARAVVNGARRMGMERPLLWINCPSAAALIDRIPHGPLVYQRTDRFEAFPGVDRATLLGHHDRLRGADLTLYCTRSLFEEEREGCRNAAFVDHGVDYDRFAGSDGSPTPEDMRGIEGPVVGFVGGIDAHTFDPELFLTVARKLPGATFVLVGGCSLPEGWCTEPNVRLLGRKPYEAVPQYMAAADVLIMPWAQNDWIKACNPIKLKEYLAVGRPIVSTPFDELERYAGLVEVAADAQSFVEAIERSLASDHDAAPQRHRVAAETWTAKAEHVLSLLEGAGGSKERGAPAALGPDAASVPVR